MRVQHSTLDIRISPNADLHGDWTLR